MADTQQKPRVTDDDSARQAEESPSADSAAGSVARMLANPRRVRRN
jgi:hypothetical protein